jgi:hypothetical protein
MKIRVWMWGALFALIVVPAAISVANSKQGRTTVNGIAWYDSFDAALEESKRTGKPILLLSMFGRIDEKMPCANARTLRATLFKDPDFMKFVTDEAIPTWEMVRPVPKVNIDFGDGHKLTRTIRGNAVMYLCNTQGKVFDAYPGVYTAGDFMPMVRKSIADHLAKTDQDVINSHTVQMGPSIASRLIRTTVGKAFVESPTLDFIGAKPTQGATPQAAAIVPIKKRVFESAARSIRDLSLTPATADEVATTVLGKAGNVNDKDLWKKIIARDSAINVGEVRPVVHAYFASLDGLPTSSQARDAILVTILKIPYKDPYFGLRDVLLPGTPD